MTWTRRAVVLLSGGVDSATTLALAKADGFEPYALTFRYGQRHELEIEAARRVAAQLGVADHVVLDIDLRAFGSSALTDDIAVPKDRTNEEIASGIPVTYVPARNTIFLSFALGWAEVLGACDIFIGVNAIDYSGYPDCRQDYIVAFQRMADLATRVGVEEGTQIRIHTPLIQMAKHEIVRAGIGLGVDYSLTMSCYDPTPDGVACGRCDACRLRLRGFAAAGMGDPVRYGADTEASG
jgi:7-cyano-7-deazaguanine synthase